MQAHDVTFNLLKLLVLPKLGNRREYLEDSCRPQDRCVWQKIRPGGQERSKPAVSALAEGPTLGSQLHHCVGTGPRTADPVAHLLPRCVKQRRMNSHRQDFRLREPGWCPGQGRDCVGVSPWLNSDVEKIRNHKGGGPSLRMQSATPLQRSWPQPTSPPGLRCQSRVSKQGQTGTSQRDPTVVAQVHPVLALRWL